MSKLSYLTSIDGFYQLLKKFDKKKHGWLHKHVPSFYKKSINHVDVSQSMYPVFAVSDFPKDLISNVVNVADKYLEGIYDILGSGPLKIHHVDWSKDYKSGYVWKVGVFYRDYIQEGIGTNSDVKWPREISRCHQLLRCAVAYDATKDKKYADYVIQQISDFIDNNPLMHSINWGCTMDVAIRAVNWIWSISIIKQSYVIPDEIQHKINHSLYEHGWFIYRNPERTSGYNHNHYLADLSGQVQLGLMFSKTPGGKTWLENGIRELFSEIRTQILPSGMSYERSTHYNRLVLELIVVPILQLKKNGYEIPQDIWYRLETMFDFLSAIIQPDGEVPIVGDQDNGRLLPFSDGDLTDFRYLMSLGAILFNRAEYKAKGDGYNLYCRYLCESKTISDFDTIPLMKPEYKSRALPDAGFYIMASDKDYLLFNASGKGLFPELCSTTHTHSDLLSFELMANGEQFLIDPGTYVYTADAEQRMYFRSTEMHNTATVDGESQNVLKKDNLWDFDRNAIPMVINWLSDDYNDFVKASHNGYTRLEDPVVHTRMVQFDKMKKEWTVTDHFDANDKHIFKLYFHTAKDISLEKANNNIILEGKRCKLNFSFSSDISVEIRVIDTFLSRSYGNKIPSKAFVVICQDNKPFDIITKINKI